MKAQSIPLVLLACCVLFLPTGSVKAQPDDHVQRIKQYFDGQKILVSYREGGAVYGTYFLLEIHYCPSGRYVLVGQSRKQTVLGNEQVNNWRDTGNWQVTHFQGQVVLYYVSTSGVRDVVPLRLLPDGRIWVNEGVSLQRQGKAQC